MRRRRRWRRRRRRPKRKIAFWLATFVTLSHVPTYLFLPNYICTSLYTIQVGSSVTRCESNTYPYFIQKFPKKVYATVLRKKCHFLQQPKNATKHFWLFRNTICQNNFQKSLNLVTLVQVCTLENPLSPPHVFIHPALSIFLSLSLSMCLNPAFCSCYVDVVVGAFIYFDVSVLLAPLGSSSDWRPLVKLIPKGSKIENFDCNISNFLVLTTLES